MKALALYRAPLRHTPYQLAEIIRRTPEYVPLGSVAFHTKASSRQNAIFVSHDYINQSATSNVPHDFSNSYILNSVYSKTSKKQHHFVFRE